MLHAHTTGTAISFRHIRDGVELEPLEVNDHYDFDFQQTTMYSEHVTILPGDQFLIHCTYDTQDRDGMVLAGEATNEEMCLAFVYVYPVPDLYMCVSGFAGEAVSKWLDDAFDEGLWDIDFSYNGSSYTVQDLLDADYISNPGNLTPEVWDDWGGHWNQHQEGAAAFYEKLLDDSTYSERLSLCYNSDIGLSDLSITSFEEEFGDFEEYCTDSCGCGDTEEESEGAMVEETTNLIMFVGIAIAAVSVILIIVLLVVMMRRNKMKNEVNTAIKKEHVAHTSTVSGIEETTAGETA